MAEEHIVEVYEHGYGKIVYLDIQNNLDKKTLVDYYKKVEQEFIKGNYTHLGVNISEPLITIDDFKVYLTIIPEIGSDLISIKVENMVENEEIEPIMYNDNPVYDKNCNQLYRKIISYCKGKLSEKQCDWIFNTIFPESELFTEVTETWFHNQGGKSYRVKKVGYT